MTAASTTSSGHQLNTVVPVHVRGMVVLDDAMYPADLRRSPTGRFPTEVLWSRRRRLDGLVRDGLSTVLSLITLEDIVEEIVGEIEEDEHDPPAV